MWVVSAEDDSQEMTSLFSGKTKDNSDTSLITTAADDSLIFLFPEKTSLDSSYETSAKQTINMKCQVLFSLKKEWKNRMSSVSNFHP